ncbi:MAG: prepilin-type N-terminal cleavage/methylation domain-containing protein [Gammaproteobacteria bacterium]|nr:prepilin-type N-terminal cleavage/methylation domain-containing protein [Gammaproteobacteria bacterium]
MTRESRQDGLTLVEVLVTMVLLSIVLIPAIRALQTGVTGANVHSDLASNQFLLTSRMEEVLAEPFGDLEAAAIAAGGSTVASSYSDAAGPPGRLLVYLAAYDGDNADADNDPFTGGDPDLMWIRAEVEGTVHELHTITARGY